jgi:cytidylate kinase
LGAQKIVVAIDGPSGCGKGTVAQRVAEELGYLHIDSGAMYRAVALFAIENDIPFEETDRVVKLAVETEFRMEMARGGARVLAGERDVSEAIRKPEVSQGASRVAVIPAVREALVKQQQQMDGAGGIVMEGRDIGTVVFPEAGLKIYLDASVEERARRRFEQDRAKGIESTLEKTIEEIEERDRRDKGREISPLRQAEDAVYVDSTALGLEEVVAVIVRLARERAKA